MIDTSGSYRSGAIAYSKARDGHSSNRIAFIANAYAVAQRRSTKTGSFSKIKSNSNVSSAVAQEHSSLVTSADELALVHDTSMWSYLHMDSASSRRALASGLLSCDYNSTQLYSQRTLCFSSVIDTKR
jgi:hypothetical protein